MVEASRDDLKLDICATYLTKLVRRELSGWWPCPPPWWRVPVPFAHRRMAFELYGGIRPPIPRGRVSRLMEDLAEKLVRELRAIQRRRRRLFTQPSVFLYARESEIDVRVEWIEKTGGRRLSIPRG